MDIVDDDARTSRQPHVNAPVADFPVGKIIGARHFVAGVTLSYVRTLYDYTRTKVRHTTAMLGVFSERDFSGWRDEGGGSDESMIRKSGTRFSEKIMRRE